MDFQKENFQKILLKNRGVGKVLKKIDDRFGYFISKKCCMGLKNGFMVKLLWILDWIIGYKGKNFVYGWGVYLKQRGYGSSIS